MASSPAALIRPCLEKICQNTATRKYSKLQKDAQTLLDKLDFLLQQRPTTTASAQTLPTTPQLPSKPEAAPEVEQVAVSLREDSEKGVSLTLDFSKFTEEPAQSKPAREVTPREEQPPQQEEGTTSVPGTPPQPRPASAETVVSSPTATIPYDQQRPSAFHLSDGAAREIMLVLSDAVDTRKPAIAEAAIDCVQKLVSFKLLEGPVYSINHRRETAARSGDNWEGPAPLQFAAQPPQAQAIELLCRCDDIADDAVELRLLKALLTAITSSTLSVHGQALLLVVRACHNIHLTSRSDINQSTAKATLTQMLNVVFQRMEAGSTRVVVPPIVVSDLLGMPSAENSNVSAFVQQFLYDVAANVDPFGYYAEGVQQGLDDAFAPEKVPPSARPSMDLGNNAMMHSDSEASDLASKATTAAKTNNAEQQQSEARGGAEFNIETDSEAAVEEGDDSIQITLQKDAFLVFRALCKLSTRSLDSVAGNEVATMRGKLLALQLLKVLLENIGPVFKSSPRFVTAIKQYLCLSLLKNASSSMPQAQHLCCSIFLTLLTKFRKSLKAEVGVFFPMMLLRPIEPTTSSGSPAASPSDVAHRVIVLRCLQVVCEDGQLLVDLFVNYDCDLDAPNLFERMVLAVVRIAQKGMLQDGLVVTGLDDKAVRYEALRCLSSCMSSMSHWYTSTIAMEAAAAGQNGVIGSGSKADADQQVGGEGGPTAPVVDETVKTSWMESLASGTVSDRIPAMVTANGAGDAAKDQAGLLESWKAFKKAFEEGIALFNKKPKRGIAYLQEQQLVGAEAHDVATFLAKTRGLDKTLIGDYLGEREPFNLEVMHSYVNAMDFQSLDFDDAIRKFLSGFRLPGEAQKIDRLMEKFADRFVSCNQESFKSADVAYVLAYSVIMLNTDAHNPMVKNKMSKQDFLRNNRGINDGEDLPPDFMEALYDRIINNEIKMKDDPIVDTGHGQVAGGGGSGAGSKQQPAPSAGWMDTVMNLIPGRQRSTTSEPTEESIRRTHDYLREKARAATFFEAKENEVVRPMLDVVWAPMLGAFSVLVEEQDDENLIALCLTGFYAAIHLTSSLQMGVLQRTYVASLARFTMLHSPGQMKPKNVQAFRTLLAAAERSGSAFTDSWQEVLRCVSRFELLHQLTAGVPTDAFLFGMENNRGGKGGTKGRSVSGKHSGKSRESFSIADMSVQMPLPGMGKEIALPPPEVLLTVDLQEINRLFVSSGSLNSEAIVEFVRTMCALAREELDPHGIPRVFSLTKLVEVAHFNMDRIRLVWSRIWVVLSDFFVDAGCHENLQVAMYVVDSLRQLAMKFLERSELTNYTFQNDFLRPFVVLMRHAKAVEIRELIIRCVSQMVLSRVSNIKSGWKSMFMVFTTAASDEDARIVRLAFDTIEKIVREHFHYITETESATFTDCVNCLIAFTNHPQSVDVCLNAIAFLRYCAIQLAEGDIGDVDALPEGAVMMDSNVNRIRDKSDSGTSPGPLASLGGGGAVDTGSPRSGGVGSQGMKFTDRDEHMYFWFPLLAGLSELTFDPRPEIRYSSQEVLFDILKFHGTSFTPQFWIRIFDSILLPIFDIVRAEVADATTFTDEKHRAESDAWLYETCTRTLQHIVDIVVVYGPQAPGLLQRLLNLLLSFIRRSHQALAAVGVAAVARLIVSAGGSMDEPTWALVLSLLTTAVNDTIPQAADLIQHRMVQRTSQQHSASAEYSNGEVDYAHANGEEEEEEAQAEQYSPSVWSLGSGSGARKLAEVKSRAAIQLLLVQALAEIFQAHAERLSPTSASLLLEALQAISSQAAAVNADNGLRHLLLLAQAADNVPADKALLDPPFIQLEIESAEAYLSALVYVVTRSGPETVEATKAHERLLQLCIRNLERFEQQTLAEAQQANESEENGVHNIMAPNLKAENEALAPLVVATLKAMLALEPEEFKTHVKEIFPLLTNLISCETAPADVQQALSEVFARRVGTLVM